MRCPRLFLSVLLAPLFLVLARPVAGAPGDENWSTIFGLPGVNGTVEASTLFEGDLVIGGNFFAVGGLAAGHVARWNGTQWTTLGSSFNNPVDALIVWNGELYAGGNFSASGATTLDGLARWNGSAWVDVGGGVNGSVVDLAIWNGDLVVAGYFEGVDGGSVDAFSVAVWDGAAWDDLDGGIEGNVIAVESYSGSLYACGEFDNAGIFSVANLARWNGTTWSAVGTGLKDSSDDQYNAAGYDLALHGGKLVIAGLFERAGSLTVDGIVGWNGSAFSTIGSPLFGGESSALGLRGTNLVAGGGSGAIRQWNGTTWMTLGSADFAVLTFVERGTDLIAGGMFTTVSAASARGVAKYNGAWSALASGQGATGTVEDFHIWNGLVIAGGRFPRIGAVSGVIGAWNGSAWTALGSGIAQTGFASVEAMATFEDDLIVGGSFANAGGVPANKIARWDGTLWSAMGAGSLSTVSGILELDGELFANGYWSGQQTLGRWNGTDFVPLGTGVSGAVQILYGLGSYQGDPVMGGSYTTVNGVAANNVARWNGSIWQPLGTGTSGSVFAVHEMGGHLFVGGTFISAGGVTVNNVAKWNGTTWSALGTGVNGRVFDLTSVGTDLFVTGEFTHASGQPVGYAARWNGSSWHALGSGLDAEGHGLLTQSDQVWVGGEFLRAGTTGSSRVARWTAATTTTAPLVEQPAGLRLYPARPNPFSAATHISFTLDRPGDVVVDIVAVNGARVRHFNRRGLEAGSHQMTWDGRDAEGRRVVAGVYLVSLRSGASTNGQKIVVVR